MNFSTPFMERSTRSSKFYAQINLLIDWTKIETLINRYYTKENTLKGEKPCTGLMLFKMLLIEIWNGLSDVQTEDLLNDSISAMRFCEKGVSSDKGYKVPCNDQLLNERKIKNGKQHKAHRNRPLTHWQKAFNKLMSKTRYVAERTFGGMKRWFGAVAARYRGIEKMHTQHILEANCYNLKRAPGLVCQLATK